MATEPTHEEVISLHRYFIAANQQRVEFDRLITEHREKHGEPIKYGGEDWNESWIAMSYWYGGLHVLVEGWRELGLADDEIDALVESPNVELLRRYRNGAFHFQRKYFDERFPNGSTSRYGGSVSTSSTASTVALSGPSPSPTTSRRGRGCDSRSPSS